MSREGHRGRKHRRIVTTTHLSEDIGHPLINFWRNDPLVLWPRRYVVRRAVEVFVRERVEPVPLETELARVAFADAGEEVFFGRGRVENVSPSSAFCLFRVGRRFTSGDDVVVFLSDVPTSVVQLFAARSDDDDVRMMTVGVERVESSLIRAVECNDGMVVDSSVSMRFLSNLAPMEFGRCVREEVGEIFFGEPLDLGIREEELFCAESRLGGNAGH